VIEMLNKMNEINVFIENLFCQNSVKLKIFIEMD